MNNPEFSDTQLVDILMRLNGDISPIGETYTDDTRFNNLIRLENTLDLILDEMYSVCKDAKHYEWSRQRAGKQAIEWMKNKQEWLSIVLPEVESDDNVTLDQSKGL